MITIKRATVEDAEEILDVKIRAFKEEVELYGFGPPGYDLLENITKTISQCFYYKIVDDNKIVGGIGVWDKGNRCYGIGSVFIDLAYQSKGIGSLAMECIEKKFPEASKWILETPYKSYRNHYFYEKMGFIKIGEFKPYVEHDNFYLFQYEKIC